MTTKTKALGLIAGLILTLSAGSGLAFAGSELRLESRIRGPRQAAGPVTGKVSFRNRLDDVRRQFSVEVERGRPGEMFDVMISGVVVGTVIVNQFGTGELDYDDTADADDNDLPFPRNFPELDGGEVVQVGPLTGTLQLK